MSYFRENIDRLAGYVPGFQPRSTEVVKLNTNENPFAPSPKVMEAIRTFPAEKLRRYPQPLGDDFRIAASKVLNIPPDHIICTNGGDDLLTLCFRAFCDETRPYVSPTPTYTLYHVLADLQSCTGIEVPYGRPDMIDNLVDAGGALTIVCNPNAPTGDMIAPRELARLASKLDGVLLIDEAYVDYSDDNCIPLVAEHDNVIILRSMSKGYSLAGLRFGFGIARPGLIEGLIKVKDSYNVDAVSIAAATAAISDQEYFRANVEKIKSQRTRLADELRQLGFEVNPSQTNFMLAKCTRFDAKDVYQSLIEREIYVRYFDLDGLNDKLRITVGTDEQNDKLIGALKEILST